MADHIWLTDRNKSIVTGFPEDLVLNGSFDRIFEFKGFDLKSGKVQHDVHPGKKVQLTGDGPEYLWTKNALERNGFNVTAEQNDMSVSIIGSGPKLGWLVRTNDSEEFKGSLADLISALDSKIF
jgi:iron complex transport system ATP-binding protein